MLYSIRDGSRSAHTSFNFPPPESPRSDVHRHGTTKSVSSSATFYVQLRAPPRTEQKPLSRKRRGRNRGGRFAIGRATDQYYGLPTHSCGREAGPSKSTSDPFRTSAQSWKS